MIFFNTTNFYCSSLCSVVLLYIKYSEFTNWIVCVWSQSLVKEVCAIIVWRHTTDKNCFRVSRNARNRDGTAGDTVILRQQPRLAENSLPSPSEGRRPRIRGKPQSEIYQLLLSWTPAPSLVDTQQQVKHIHLFFFLSYTNSISAP